MRRASEPTACTWPVSSENATTDGSKSTIPRPRMQTSVFAVPRSTARSRPPKDPHRRTLRTLDEREAAGSGLSPGGGGCYVLGGAGLVVADVVRRDGLGLAERVAPRSADPDGDPVADHHLAGLDHGRDAVLPEQ